MKYLIRISSLDIFLVQETKLVEQEFLKVSNFFWKKGEGVAVSARGASGGLGTLWNSSKFELVHTTSYTHWILTILHHKDLGHLVSIFNIKKKLVGVSFRCS